MWDRGWTYTSPPKGRWHPAEVCEFERAVAAGALVRTNGGLKAVCPVFGVEQGEGEQRKTRLIHDLRPLNCNCAEPPRFALDSLLSLPGYVAAQPRLRVAAQLDLTRAYWQVPITPSSSTYLGCRSPEGSLFTWSCLPFGWGWAPITFQSITACMRDGWREAGIPCTVYLDNFLVLAEDGAELLRYLEVVVHDMLDAGFQLAAAKCDVVPRETVRHLGLEVHVAERAFSLPSEKITQIVVTARALMAAGVALRHELETLIGRCSFARLVLPRAGLFLVHLYALCPSSDADGLGERHPWPGIRLSPRGRRNQILTLSTGAMEELEWWSGVAPARLGRKAAWDRLACARLWSHYRQPGRTVVAEGRSDASDSGVGYTWYGVDDARPVLRRVADLLPPALRSASSTARELYGAARLLEDLPEEVERGALVCVVLDSQSAVATAAGGSACRGTVDAARRIDAALEARGVDAVFEWAPREELAAEDAGSRAAVADASHASVTPAALHHIARWAWRGRGLEVDLFASEANALTPGFGSRWPCAGSMGDGVVLLRRLGRVCFAGTVWGYPPFPLARVVTVAALAAVADHHGLMVVLLLPWDPERCAVMRVAGWSATAGPRTVQMPGGEPRAPARPLVLFASPACQAANNFIPPTLESPACRASQEREIIQSAAPPPPQMSLRRPR